MNFKVLIFILTQLNKKEKPFIHGFPIKSKKNTSLLSIKIIAGRINGFREVASIHFCCYSAVGVEQKSLAFTP